MDAALFIALLLASCGVAVCWGGAPERIAAGLLLLSVLLSVLLGANEHGYRHIEWGVFGVDCALLVALFALALRANRYWPLWITSMQLATVFSHLAFATMDLRIPWAYAVAGTIWSFPSQIILAWGTLRHRDRKRRFGADPPWNGYSNP